jgi:outer membrane lipoprotein SlyB
MTTVLAKTRIHPLMAAAAASVLLVSLVGIAAITGILPNSHGTAAPAASAPLANASAPTLTTGLGSTAPVAAAPQHHTAPHKTHTTQTTSNVNGPITVAHAQQVCSNCGTVESVRAITQHVQQGSGIGAVTGALLGGVLANKVGGGDGRKLATVAGAIGGGFAGNEIEKRTRTSTHYEVRVRMEDGSIRTFTPSGEPGWNTGDHVRVVDGNLTTQG